MLKKMSPEDFMRSVIELYHEARVSTFPEDNIIRGRSSAISSKLEDLLARFIARNIKKDFTFYLDQCMTFSATKRYPDIVLQAKNGDIPHLLDVKADIGWKRSKIVDFCKEWDTRISKIKGTKTNFKLGTTKEERSGQFTNSLVYHVVIITAINGGKNLSENVNKVNNDLEHVRLYVLSTGAHPNEYMSPPDKKILSKNDVFKLLQIKKTEFDKLMCCLNE